jgi:hypothetical protein
MKHRSVSITQVAHKNPKPNIKMKFKFTNALIIIPCQPNQSHAVINVQAGLYQAETQHAKDRETFETYIIEHMLQLKVKLTA